MQWTPDPRTRRVGALAAIVRWRRGDTAPQPRRHNAVGAERSAGRILGRSVGARPNRCTVDRQEHDSALVSGWEKTLGCRRHRNRGSSAPALGFESGGGLPAAFPTAALLLCRARAPRRQELRVERRHTRVVRADSANIPAQSRPADQAGPRHCNPATGRRTPPSVVAEHTRDSSLRLAEANRPVDTASPGPFFTRKPTPSRETPGPRCNPNSPTRPNVRESARPNAE